MSFQRFHDDLRLRELLVDGLELALELTLGVFGGLGGVGDKCGDEGGEEDLVVDLGGTFGAGGVLCEERLACLVQELVVDLFQVVEEDVAVDKGRADKLGKLVQLSVLVLVSIWRVHPENLLAIIRNQVKVLSHNAFQIAKS